MNLRNVKRKEDRYVNDTCLSYVLHQSQEALGHTESWEEASRVLCSGHPAIERHELPTEERSVNSGVGTHITAPGRVSS